MKRVYRTLSSILLAIVILLSGCTGGASEDALSTEELQALEEERLAEVAQRESEAEAAISTNPIDDISDAFDIILNQCSSEFIGHHLVDESFLAWMYVNYGETSIEQAATAVQNEYEDVEIWYHITGKSIHVLWDEYCRDSGFQSDELERVYWKDTASDEKIIMDFTGDVNFAEGMGNMLYLDSCENGIYDCISDELLTEMISADLLMINNEFTYSTRGTPLEGKPFTFRADPTRVSLLEAMGVDIVGLANNHVWDYGEIALEDTLLTLQEAGMPYVGAGEDIDEAEEITYFIMNGRKIAICAATQIERSLDYTKEATETRAGVLKTLDPTKFVAVLEEANEKADYVIAFVHWGTEGDEAYGSDQYALAKAFVDAGADAIIGGHTHCLQGISYIDDVPIIYSLGNFWFSTTSSDGYAKEDTGIAQIIIDSDGYLQMRFIPCIQEKWVTFLAADEEKERILQYMSDISDGVNIDNNGYVVKR